MKRPNYLIFGMIWLMAAVVSLMNFVQYLDDRGNLIRAGLFLALSIFYFWRNKTEKRKEKQNRR